MPYKDKNCLECESEYSPNSSTQKYCFSCGKEKRRENRKEYFKEYWKEYSQRSEVKKRLKEYRESNKEKLLKQKKEYGQLPEVKKRKKDYDKKYRQRSEVQTRVKEYRQKPEVKKRNRESCKKNYQRPEVKKRRKKYNQILEVKERMRKRNQKPEVKAKKREYYQKPKVKKRRNENERQRIKNDTGWAIQRRLRVLLRQTLRTYTKTGKITSASKYGINYKAIIKHLKPFPEDLSNYHVDHIKPLCSFNLEDPEEVKKAFAPENHQWLTAFENISKGGRY